jgi:putative endonuclease
MAFLYFLVSLSDGKKYIGSTVNLEVRLKQHYSGQVESTKNRRPLKLIGWRELSNIKEAAFWEKKYKRSHDQVERDIKNGKIRKVPG